MKKCPVCGHTLKIIFYGEPTEETEKLVEKNSQFLTLGGCMCFGDDRDPDYICPKCNGEFSYDLEQIKLISCPLEAGGAIREDECRNYELLEKKDHYALLDNRELICNRLCPLMGKRIRIHTSDGSFYEGELMRTHQYTYSIHENFLSLSNKRDEYHYDYTNILISDIKEIEAI